jgi:hypothetical protein
MKKLNKNILGLLIMVALFCALTVTNVLAVGTWSDATMSDQLNERVRELCYTFTADAAAATIPTKTPSAGEYAFIKGYLLCYIKTDPGATGPTNGAWDVLFVGNTSAMADITGGAAANLSSTLGQIYQTKDSGGNAGCVPITENFAITITGNAVNSAVAQVCGIYYKP